MWLLLVSRRIFESVIELRLLACLISRRRWSSGIYQTRLEFCKQLDTRWMIRQDDYELLLWFKFYGTKIMPYTAIYLWKSPNYVSLVERSNRSLEPLFESPQLNNKVLILEQSFSCCRPRLGNKRNVLNV